MKKKRLNIKIEEVRVEKGFCSAIGAGAGGGGGSGGADPAGIGPNGAFAGSGIAGSTPASSGGFGGWASNPNHTMALSAIGGATLGAWVSNGPLGAAAYGLAAVVSTCVSCHVAKSPSYVGPCPCPCM